MYQSSNSTIAIDKVTITLSDCQYVVHMWEMLTQWETDTDWGWDQAHWHSTVQYSATHSLLFTTT